MPEKKIPEERLIELQNKLSLFPSKSSDKKIIITEFADHYGVSVNTVYRRLRERKRPKPVRLSDFGTPRNISRTEMVRYCQIIAAMKIKTNNKKNHHLSTSEAIRLLEYGVKTPDGFVKISKSLIKKSTINRYMKKWGYTLETLSIEPTSVRFQAKYSNECWHFDLSPSDLKSLDEWPEWIDTKKRKPVMMLYSVVDDRSGVAYQKYHPVFGEDVEAALRFLFDAMAPKDIEGYPFQGIPDMIYLDNGPIARSLLFQRVMDYLNITIKRHMPKGKDGRRTTSRAKGKVERPFRTVKEVHETLYHFHKPKNIEEANEWLINYILRYCEKDHRSEPHSRIEDWRLNLPVSGIKSMCTWERFCTFAREPERRKVGPDAKVSVNGILFDVSGELADQKVILWWGIFDNDLYIELGDKRYGPYHPENGPIPLHRFRSFKKSPAEKRADKIEQLAEKLQIPISVLTDDSRPPEALLRKLPKDTIINEFQDPDPFQEFIFPNVIAAKLAISNELGTPLAKLSNEDLQIINKIIEKTMKKKEVLSMVNDHFKKQRVKR